MIKCNKNVETFQWNVSTIRQIYRRVLSNHPARESNAIFSHT
jgi:hypothetical protein